MYVKQFFFRVISLYFWVEGNNNYFCFGIDMFLFMMVNCIGYGQYSFLLIFIFVFEFYGDIWVILSKCFIKRIFEKVGFDY